MQRVKRLWTWFTRPSARLGLGWIVLAGGIGGVVLWGGFNTFMEYTNTMDFCISCHEMRANPYVEYQSSAHFQNRTGVHAICSDCHVPRDWTAKLVRKIQATNELFHHLRGTLDTPEKYDAKRRELAEHVWASMRANDSRECRNCHSYDAMAFHKQTRRGAEKMQEAAREGKTCIECHQGIAHRLPPRED